LGYTEGLPGGGKDRFGRDLDSLGQLHVEARVGVPEGAREAFGHDGAPRSRSGAISLDLIANGGDHGNLQRHKLPNSQARWLWSHSNHLGGL
jgi:hypothetical protein